MARKRTIKIAVLREKANKMLNDSMDFVDRKGIICLLESVLMDTGNYAGFRYLTESYPVCRDNKHITCDETRRHYYAKFD